MNDIKISRVSGHIKISRVILATASSYYHPYQSIPKTWIPGEIHPLLFTSHLQ